MEGQSLDIGWHLFPGDNSAQILQKLKVFMLETGHEPDSCPDRINLAGMFNNIANWESPKVQTECLAEAEEVANYAARFRYGYWCFCGPGSDKSWAYNEDRPS